MQGAARDPARTVPAARVPWEREEDALRPASLGAATGPYPPKGAHGASPTGPKALGLEGGGARLAGFITHRLCHGVYHALDQRAGDFTKICTKIIFGKAVLCQLNLCSVSECR